MRKIKNLTKNNIKLLIAFIIGSAVAGSIGIAYAAILMQGTAVTYSNTTSGLSSTTVQAAIDEVYGKIDSVKSSSNFIEAYTYNSSTCVTGNESTCVATTCYKTKSANSCPAGTIIRYKVRPGEVETFHVMYDDASTITMQTQKNTVYNTAWITEETYLANGGNYAFAANNKGPLTILPALESATAGWSNVKDQTYTAGTTTFKTNAYTGCSGSYANISCTENRYTLSSRTAKARMITMQEAMLLGCNGNAQTCPIWMYNYFVSSTYYGGTVDDSSHLLDVPGTNGGYWTMTATDMNNYSWYVCQNGALLEGNMTSSYIHQGARAVVVVNK